MVLVFPSGSMNINYVFQVMIKILDKSIFIKQYIKKINFNTIYFRKIFTLVKLIFYKLK
tara:strand:+ start:745 stop:921 length:177 start_codon:yes stop_codon:yes gene_type:complete